MLGKLFKYDIKSLGRFIFPLYAVLFGSAIAVRIFFEFFGSGADASGAAAFVYKLIGSVVAIVYCLAIMASIFGVYVVIAINYNKSLMSDRGYFYLTLPVSHDMHLVGKLLAGAVLILLSVIVFVLSFLPFFIGNIHLPDVLKVLTEVWDTIRELFLSKNAWLILTLMAIVCLFGVQILIFFCITVGQLMPGHRILGAFLAFIVHTIFSRTIAGIFASVGLERLDFNVFDMDVIGEALSGILLRSIIYYLIIYVVEYIITRYVMKNKLNIE